MRKHLAFLLTRQIGAGRWSGQVELGGVAGMLGHGGLKPSRFEYNVASVPLNSEARIRDAASTCELRNRDTCLRPLGSPAGRLSSNPPLPLPVPLAQCLRAIRIVDDDRADEHAM